MARDLPLTKTKSQKARARAASSSVRPALKGNGAYSMADVKNALKPVVREALANGGAAIGGLSSLPGGSVFGREMGRQLSKLIGSGDYQTNTSVNALIHPPGGVASASFGEDMHTIRLRRREFITDVLAPAIAGNFVNYPYAINAGNRSTFPFLSQLAVNYEEYCFDGLVFEFISSASPYIANSAVGTVIAAMQYNSSAPIFANKYTMENSAFAVSTRIDKNLMYGVECAKGSNAQNCYYVRSGASTLPLTTTDLGNFQLALAPSSTIPANTVLGELWVTYDIVLKRPVLNENRYGVFHLHTTSGSNTAPVGAVGYIDQDTNLGAVNWRWDSTSSLAFSDAVPGDVFMMTYSYIGTTAGVGTATVPGVDVGGSTNISAFNGFGNLTGEDKVSFAISGPITTATSIAFTTMFTVTSTAGVLKFATTGTNWPASPVSVDVYVNLIGHGLVPASI